MLVQRGTIKVLFALFAAVLILCGCSRNGDVPKQSPINEQQSVIDWVDFLMINNTSYTGSWQAALTDPSKLGEEIGKVAFHVTDQIHDPHYIPQDGDAAFLAVGSVVHAIADYPNHEIVAVQDIQSIGGYKIYVEDSKRKELILSFEDLFQNNKATEISFFPMNSVDKPIVVLNKGREQFLISMLQKAAKDRIQPDKAALTTPVDYRFMINNGKAIGYVDTIYKIDNHYYWNHPEAKQLPDAFAYYFTNEREVVYKNHEIEFPLPNHVDSVISGERIKRDGSINNITLISPDGKTERSLFTEESIAELWKKAIEINPSDGEDKASLFMADRAMPVDDGKLIAFVTNKDTAIKHGNGAFNLNLIQLDGTKDRVLVEGTEYGRYIILLDSVGDRIIAEGADRSILDISISTGKVQHYPINGHLDALSIDGRYVLYRKMSGDSMVGTEIAAFDLTNGKAIELGQMENNYVFAQGIK